METEPDEESVQEGRRSFLLTELDSAFPTGIRPNVPRPSGDSAEYSEQDNKTPGGSL